MASDGVNEIWQIFLTNRVIKKAIFLYFKFVITAVAAVVAIIDVIVVLLLMWLFLLFFIIMSALMKALL